MKRTLALIYIQQLDQNRHRLRKINKVHNLSQIRAVGHLKQEPACRRTQSDLGVLGVTLINFNCPNLARTAVYVYFNCTSAGIQLGSRQYHVYAEILTLDVMRAPLGNLLVAHRNLHANIGTVPGDTTFSRLKAYSPLVHLIQPLEVQG